MHAQLVGQLRRPVDQAIGGIIVVRDDAAGIDIRQAYEETPKEEAVYMGKRQSATRLCARARLQQIGHMAQAARQHGEPAGVPAQR